MYNESDKRDRTQPFVKMVVIEGREYPCTVLPPGPAESDETVWRVPKQTHASPQEAIATYYGPSWMQDYALARFDRES